MHDADMTVRGHGGDRVLWVNCGCVLLPGGNCLLPGRYWCETVAGTLTLDVCRGSLRLHQKMARVVLCDGWSGHNCRIMSGGQGSRGGNDLLLWHTCLLRSKLWLLDDDWLLNHLLLLNESRS